MRKTAASIQRNTATVPHRVVDFGDLMSEWAPELHFLARAHDQHERETIEHLSRSGLNNIGWIQDGPDFEDGDLIVPAHGKLQSPVIYREGDRHHALQVTNRCNSKCLMCSQPPTTQNDDWMLEEAYMAVNTIRKMPDVLGISGGEPLLNAKGLRRLIDLAHSKRPDTLIEVLSNGRGFYHGAIVDAALQGQLDGVRWLIPLYGHCDYLHDYVVQSAGAFEETLCGLLELQRRNQPIQLRIVLIRPVLEALSALCRFIGKNLPFVSEVALMACEPIGFALANRAICEVDLKDWHGQLLEAAEELDNYHVPYVFMNAPLCSLPAELQPAAHRSISDWKNVYDQECQSCSMKNRCCGLFAWYEKGWQPTKIQAIKEVYSEEVCN
ncbi:MAG: His-Xaa-Ser system radical SAM maturase HxsC [Alcanivorax sp.]|uniref:His-Xaa-Ser system radical SAM maturase HxsC n=1 Tax=Alloalcanivorax marinus TaxID=1177169 RepID=UPI00195B1C35|nr:His-Xaa-Ser system radical SAM maturase HxsC [Alloalcanivorax marinus]MBM7335011.1 His-Xaa-Ser system radical SAM maturase HxsC [Alloalcanivorax marinus]